jgi:methylated-DNA-protein-cysteine methyltransferase-like protein
MMRSPTSAFRNQVYVIVRAIPRGRVMTYGAIGALIPPPPAVDWPAYARIRARWVGYALADCPEDVAWHRVVNAKGRVSPRIGHGPHLQRILLEEEGVNFDGAQRLDLSAHGWAPDTEWRDAHGML